MPTTGIYPCYENQFKTGTHGAQTATLPIADMEEFSVSFDNGVQEYIPFDSEGWTKRLLTTKGVTISVKGKRCIGDAGNDAIAGLAFKNGREAEVPFLWTFPDGTQVLFANAVVSVTAIGSGASGDVGPLEFDVLSNGKPQSNGNPTVTPPGNNGG